MATRKRSASPVPMGEPLSAADAELDALTTADAMQALAAHAIDGGPPDALDAYVRAEPDTQENGDGST